MASKCELCGQPLTDTERVLEVNRCSACAEGAPRVYTLALNGRPSPDYAGFWQRAAAYVVDYIFAFAAALTAAFLVGLVVWVVSVIAGWDFGAKGEEEAAANVATWAAMAIGAFVVAFYFWLGNAFGGTPSKRMLGLRVICPDCGDNIGLKRGLARCVVQLVGGLPLALGWLASTRDSRRRSWHDKAVDSVVVREVW